MFLWEEEKDGRVWLQSQTNWSIQKTFFASVFFFLFLSTSLSHSAGRLHCWLERILCTFLSASMSNLPSLMNVCFFSIYFLSFFLSRRWLITFFIHFCGKVFEVFFSKCDTKARRNICSSNCNFVSLPFPSLTPIPVASPVFWKLFWWIPNVQMRPCVCGCGQSGSLAVICLSASSQSSWNSTRYR